MAIKFTFTLNDVDAENMMHFMQHQINDARMSIFEETVKGKDGENRQPYIDWYKASILYIERMMEIMLSNQERVKDSEEYECSGKGKQKA